jgi:Flp pilus assembly pilin Flp
MKTLETKKTRHRSRRLRRFVRANEAVSALEYAILIGVIAVAIAAALLTFSASITTALGNIGTGISGITQTTPDTD